MKISRYDRLQAIKHSTKYKDDYLTYVRLRGAEDGIYVGQASDYHIKLSEAGRVLCEKWNIQMPIPPIGLEAERDIPPGEPLKWETIYPIPVDSKSDSSISPESSEEEDLEWEKYLALAPVSHLDPPKNWKSYKGNFFQSADNINKITHVNGKLALLVDTRFSLPQVMKAVEDFVRPWITEYNSRVKNNKLDPWLIYRLHAMEGKNFLQIVRDLFGIEENPTYNEEADRYRALVSRAYDKADRIISHIEKEAEKTSSSPTR